MPVGDLIRVIPGFLDLPLDDASLAVLVSGETAFLSQGFFEGMVTEVHGAARGNYSIPPACAGPQPVRTTSRRHPPVGWVVQFAGRRLPAEEFAALHPDIDQTMLADSGGVPFPETLHRMIECGWLPWMGQDQRWMYPEDDDPVELPAPARPAPYPVTAVPGKFLIEQT